MEVILKEDINKLGHRGDVVKVADGYGRNYLLPGKLAMEATPANKAVIEQMKASAIRKSASEKGGAEELATKLNELVLTFERATPSVSTISSAFNGLGEMNKRAWVWATVRLMPQRVPISPQWRIKFCWTGLSWFIFL